MPSTVIRRFTYYADSQILQIVFVSGMIYNYLDVPAQVYEELKAAFSKGTYFNQQIKNNYEAVKVGNEEQ